MATTTQQNPEDVLARMIAARAPATQPTTKAQTDAARAELDARQRQGVWVKRRDAAGQLIAPVQVATYGGAASALKMAAE